MATSAPSQPHAEQSLLVTGMGAAGQKTTKHDKAKQPLAAASKPMPLQPSQEHNRAAGSQPGAAQKKTGMKRARQDPEATCEMPHASRSAAGAAVAGKQSHTGKQSQTDKTAKAVNKAANASQQGLGAASKQGAGSGSNRDARDGRNGSHAAAKPKSTAAAATGCTSNKPSQPESSPQPIAGFNLAEALKGALLQHLGATPGDEEDKREDGRRCEAAREQQGSPAEAGSSVPADPNQASPADGVIAVAKEFDLAGTLKDVLLQRMTGRSPEQVRTASRISDAAAPAPARTQPSNPKPAAGAATKDAAAPGPDAAAARRVLRNKPEAGSAQPVQCRKAQPDTAKAAAAGKAQASQDQGRAPAGAAPSAAAAPSTATASGPSSEEPAGRTCRMADVWASVVGSVVVQLPELVGAGPAAGGSEAGPSSQQHHEQAAAHTAEALLLGWVVGKQPTRGGLPPAPTLMQRLSQLAASGAPAPDAPGPSAGPTTSASHARPASRSAPAPAPGPAPPTGITKPRSRRAQLKQRPPRRCLLAPALQPKPGLAKPAAAAGGTAAAAAVAGPRAAAAAGPKAGKPPKPPKSAREVRAEARAALMEADEEWAKDKKVTSCWKQVQKYKFVHEFYPAGTINPKKRRKTAGAANH